MALWHNPTRLLVAGGAAGGGLLLGLIAGVDPKLAIVVSITCAYVLITFADLSVGLALFVVLSFLETLSVGGAAVSITKVLGLVLALSWLALVATRGEAKTDLFSAHPAASYALVLLVGWSALSATWAESSSSALSVTFRFLNDGLLFVIVYTAVRDRRTAQLVVGAFVLGAVVAAAYGLVASPAIPGAEGRLNSGLFDPNELAAILVGGGILSLGLASAWRGEPAASGLALGASAWCLAALFLTASRGGLIALIAAMFAALFFGGRWRWLAAVLAVMIASGGFLYFKTIAPQDARDRITEVTQGEAGQQEGRATIWKVGWRMFEAEPIHGVGAGNFANAALKFVVRPGEAPRSDRLVSEPAVAHNSYLEMFSELGLVGGVLFLLLIGFSLVSAIRAAHLFERLRDRSMEVMSRALLIALVATLAADFFISEEFSKQLWLLLALGPALLGIAMQAERESEPTSA
jgi:putative inorganic carbon (HCO3(-)) transporter